MKACSLPLSQLLKLKPQTGFLDVSLINKLTKSGGAGYQDITLVRITVGEEIGIFPPRMQNEQGPLKYLVMHLIQETETPSPPENGPWTSDTSILWS